MCIGHEESPVGDSKSNGVIENVVKAIQGHSRTIRDGLEARYQRRIEGEHEERGRNSVANGWNLESVFGI